MFLRTTIYLEKVAKVCCPIFTKSLRASVKLRFSRPFYEEKRFFMKKMVQSEQSTIYILHCHSMSPNVWFKFYNY